MNKLIFLTTMILCGCSSVSEVTQIGKDSYMVGATGMGLTNRQETKAMAVNRANNFCKSKGKFLMVDTVSVSGINGWTPRESELTFLCVDENDPAYQRTNMRKEPDTIVELKK